MFLHRGKKPQADAQERVRDGTHTGKGKGHRGYKAYGQLRCSLRCLISPESREYFLPNKYFTEEKIL